MPLRWPFPFIHPNEDWGLFWIQILVIILAIFTIFVFLVGFGIISLSVLS